MNSIQLVNDGETLHSVHVQVATIIFLILKNKVVYMLLVAEISSDVWTCESTSWYKCFSDVTRPQCVHITQRRQPRRSGGVVISIWRLHGKQYGRSEDGGLSEPQRGKRDASAGVITDSSCSTNTPFFFFFFFLTHFGAPRQDWNDLRATKVKIVRVQVVLHVQLWRTEFMWLKRFILIIWPQIKHHLKLLWGWD